METLFILREWLYGEGEELKEFTLDELKQLQTTLRMEGEEFSQFITGLNCDEYSDQLCDIMSDLYEGDPEQCYSLCMEDMEFQTCYTVYRIWNQQHTTEQALKFWREAFFCTLESVVDT